MKLDINPVYICGFNCLENSIHSILKWKSITYEKAFIDSWPFSMQNAEDIKLLGEKINAIPAIETASKYMKYCDIECNTYDRDSIADPIDLIKTEIINNKSPVLVGIDIFYCPWVKQYHEQHGSHHFFTIIGIDDDNIYCMDANLLECNGKMCKKDFVNYYETIITLKYPDTNSTLPDLKSHLNKFIGGLGLFSKSNNTFTNLRNFADIFEKVDLEKESEGFSDSSIPLFIGIVRIYGSRYQMKKYMEFLQSNYDDEVLKFFIERFTKVLNQWSSIKSLTSKALILRSEEMLPNISNRIRRVTDMEENLAVTIHDYIHDKPFSICNDYQKISAVKNYCFLDLTKYYNNKGFESKNASLSRIGEYFLMNGLPASTVWIKDNMKFNFSNVVDAKYDNISCAGQLIECIHGKFSYIMFLYCAEFGSFVENIKISYNDGTDELAEYTASDWYGEPEFQETVAWSGMVTSKAKDAISKRNVFAKCIDINKDKKVVTSIKLPNCANIHIFSITLA